MVTGLRPVQAGRNPAIFACLQQLAHAQILGLPRSLRLYNPTVNIHDERSVGEQVRSGLRLAGWVLLTLAVVGVMVGSETVLSDRDASILYRAAGGCGLMLVAVLMFISVERWGKWFVGALGYWILKAIFTLPFRPSMMLLDYLLLFILALALCVRCVLSRSPRPAIEKLGMVMVVVALGFSLRIDSPLPLLVGVAALALTQVASYVFRATDHANVRETP